MWRWSSPIAANFRGGWSAMRASFRWLLLQVSPGPWHGRGVAYPLGGPLVDRRARLSSLIWWTLGARPSGRRDAKPDHMRRRPVVIQVLPQPAGLRSPGGPAAFATGSGMARL